MPGFSAIGSGPIAGSSNQSLGASTVTSVTLSPATVSVAGSASQTFTATVNGTNGPSQAVTWSADAGAVVGGVFIAPAATGSAQTITITATSVQDSSKSGTATVTVPAIGALPDPDLFPQVFSFTLMRATVTDSASHISATGIDSIGTFL